MKKNILIYGCIAGLIVSSIMLFTTINMSHCEGSIDYGKSMLIGYASMLLSMSFIFIGIRNYRNKYNGGLISFGKAFKIGILIALIAATFYVAAWEIAYFFFVPDFMEKYSAHELEQLKASGATQAAIAAKTKEMADFARMYKNPFFNAVITYMEILPVGLIVTLISALILKKKARPTDGLITL